MKSSRIRFSLCIRRVPKWVWPRLAGIACLGLLLTACQPETPPVTKKAGATPVPGAIANEPLKYGPGKVAAQPKVDHHVTKNDPPIATIPHKVTIREIGMPFYPGSQPDPKGKNGETRLGGKVQYVSERIASDSPSKVADWYHKKILGSVVTGSDVVKMVTGNLAGGQKFQIVAVKREGKTHVVISTAAN